MVIEDDRKTGIQSDVHKIVQKVAENVKVMCVISIGSLAIKQEKVILSVNIIRKTDRASAK